MRGSDASPGLNEQLTALNAELQKKVGELERAGDALRDFARQRQLALDAAGMGWWHYDPVTHAATWDAGYARIFGVTDRGRCNDDVLSQLIHPDDLPGLWAQVQAALDPASPRPFAAEYRIRRPDGAVRWIEAHGIASFEGEGSLRRATSFAGTVADITARREAEEALRASEVKYRSLYDNMAEEVHVWEVVRDAAGEIVTWRLVDANRSALATWGGGTVEALRGKTPDEIFGPGTVADCLPLVRRMMAEHNPCTYDHCFPAFGKHFHLTSAPFGEQFITTATDITALKNAHRELALTQPRYAAIHDHAPFAIALMTHPDGIITEVNDAWVQLFACPREEAVGQTTAGLGLIEEPENRSRMYEVIGSRGQVRNWEMQIRTRGGERRLASFSFDLIEIGDQHYMLGTVMDVTGRRAAEAALRESERRFQLALRHAPVSVAVQDKDLRYTWAYNQRTARTEEIIGHFDHEIFAPTESGHIESQKRRVLTEEIELRERMWLDRPSGRIFLDVLWEPLRDDAGQVVGVSSATVDLTQAKLAEEALQAEHAKLEAIVESLDVGVLVTNREGDTLSMNSAAHRILDLCSGARRPPRDDASGPIERPPACRPAGSPTPGRGPASIAGRLCVTNLAQLAGTFELRALDGTLLPDEARPSARALRGDFCSDLELRMHDRRTQREWIASWSVSPVRDAEGETRLLAFLVQDITTRKHAEEELRESEARCRATFEQAPVGIAHVSLDGHWLRVNQKLCDILGYRREELATLGFPDVFPTDEGGTLAPVRGSPKGQGVVCSERRYVRRDGSTVWIGLRRAPVHRSDGTPDYVIAVVEDITERKRAAAALRALNDMTRFQIANQTVSAITHELSQPLNAVTSYAEAALRLLRAGNPAPERLSHAIEHSALQAKRAGRVVRELLAVMNQGEVQTKRLCLNETVRRVAAQVEADGYANPGIRLDLAADLARVSANRLQIEKVLLNLIENSIEAMRDAGVDAGTVTVRTRADGLMAQVTVADSGPGIDAEALHRVFQPFFTTKPRGLGMGLAISRGIVESHGGRLWVESEAGAGAQFHFSLPFAEGP